MIEAENIEYDPRERIYPLDRGIAVNLNTGRREMTTAQIKEREQLNVENTASRKRQQIIQELARSNGGSGDHNR